MLALHSHRFGERGPREPHRRHEFLAHAHPAIRARRRFATSAEGKVTQADLARRYNVSRSTISRLQV
ncbi:hypothetical protein F7D13_10295 [Methylocystis rosea]|uniref:Helix-turn-helix domain-containing protein n=1 Tax=Methylocystis rosea TaxID=173366 RepID=A0ABX6EKH5_9HYPH|nr:hypothetical protein F7D13_10295 [Methylocystis rosea]